MQFKAQINELLGKRMDRRGFLKHVLFGLVGLIGLSSVLKLLASSEHKSASGAYDDSIYGGTGDGK